MIDCVITPGKPHWSGYVYQMRGGVVKGAHVWAWIEAHGPVPPGMLVCHTCDNPPCRNVEHLFLGTIGDNNRDCNAKGRRNVPTGDRSGSRLHPERRPRGELHGEARLTAVQVLEIRRRYAVGLSYRRRHPARISQRALATEYGVVQGTVGFIVRNETWTHLGGAA